MRYADDFKIMCSTYEEAQRFYHSTVAVSYTHLTDKNGNTDVAEVKASTVYIKELSAPAGYKVDKTV